MPGVTSFAKVCCPGSDLPQVRRQRASNLNPLASGTSQNWSTPHRIHHSVTESMQAVKTPCIGICSTTSLGDKVCRGCKRYAFEVIDWNSYDVDAKSAVLRRIEKLVCQILENKLRIFSVPNLKLGLEQLVVPYDPTLSPYCWLHNLLRKRHRQIGELQEYGVYVLPDFAHLALTDLCEMIEAELQVLCEAHFQRYVSPVGRIQSA